MRKSLLFLALLLWVSPAWGTTRYMGSGETYTNLQAAMAASSGGDTIIIRDGTYTGSTNVIDSSHMPPAGSSGAYTIIQAEHDGLAIFDGENARTMFDVQSDGSKYWRFEGIVWTRGGSGSTVYLKYADYVKFLRCGADCYIAGAYPWSLRENSYVLVEGCYGFGMGRYQFICYICDHIIFRQCVGRPDDIDAGNAPEGDPASGMSIYTSTYVKVQNCIIIDGDQTGAWDNINVHAGAFSIATTSGNTENVDFDQCIGLNFKLGGLLVAQNSPTSNINFNNMALWDCDDSATFGIGLRNPASVSHCTYGAADMLNHYCDGDSSTIKNSIFYANNAENALFYDVETQDYNNFYGNSNTTGTSGAHNQTYSPLSNGLLYLPRIEAASNLKTAGESGGQIGAQCMTLIGTSGTLWGETGYATDTEVSMWPFPNEDLIKTKMAAYSHGGVSGARGFCASGKQLNGTDDITLTSYIWEYLGNEMPSDIYGEEEDTTDPEVAITSPTSSATYDNGSSSTITLEGTASDDTGVESVTWENDRGGSGSATGTTSWSIADISLSSGDNVITVTATDAASNMGTDVITVTYTPEPPATKNQGISGSGVSFH